VALRDAGIRETGGQLFGEQLAPSHFVVNEVTVQARPGTPAHFDVDVAAAMRDAARYFDRTGHDYLRFNYLGEWHSHPRYQVLPSNKDMRTMLELVSDADFKGNFAILMIARRDVRSLRLAAWVYGRGGTVQPVALEVDE
jgi:proteasome lid subunit RPN8/RPN11